MTGSKYAYQQRDDGTGILSDFWRCEYCGFKYKDNSKQPHWIYRGEFAGYLCTQCKSDYLRYLNNKRLRKGKKL